MINTTPMDIKEILSLPFHKMTEQENLLEMATAYKEELNRTVCTTCRGSLHEMIINLKRHYNMSTFQIKNNKHYRLDKGSAKTINNNIITDELALEFLRINPERIQYFEQYPENWEEMLEGKIESEPFEDTDEEAFVREELSKKKLHELREEYPNIKQVSKEDFITDILKEQRKEDNQ